MSLDSESREHLREWLIKSLEPICDADPDVLSKYVLALVQNDKEREDLRDLVIEKLEEFLGDETMNFVNRLFSALSTDSYRPDGGRDTVPENEAEVEVENPVLEPGQEQVSSDLRPRHRRRRSHSSDDDKHKQTGASMKQEDWRAKRRRMSDDGDRHDRVNRRSPRKNDRQSRNEDDGSHNQNRRIYRDINRGGRGFDRRGDWAPRGGRMPGAWGYRDRNFLHGRMGMRGGIMPDFDAEAYNPDNPSMDLRRAGVNPHPVGSEMGIWENPMHMMNVGNPMMGYNPAMMGPEFYRPGAGRRGGRGGRHRHDGPRVVENGEPGKQDKETRFEDQTVLKLTHIDPNFVNVTKLSYHFSKFGNVLNASINPETKTALIQLSSHEEAVKAYKSPMPVCNNRFIKVFFEHGIPPGAQLNVDDSSQTTGNPTVPLAELSPEEAKAAAAAQGKEVLASKIHLLDQQRSIRKQKEVLLTNQLAQHKALLSKMNELGNSSHDDKINLITRMNELTTMLKEFRTTPTTSATDLTEKTQSDVPDNSPIEGLQAEYEALESEVAAGRGSGGWRGRGRGAWRGHRGRGMVGRGMNLDNRSRTIKVMNLPVEGREPIALKQHFETFGVITDVSINSQEIGTAYIRFQDRYGAEAAMNHGSFFGETKLPITWHQGIFPGDAEGQDNASKMPEN